MSDYNSNSQRRCGTMRSKSRWHPIELIAMIVGFAIYWPIGFAVFGLKMWQRRTGHQGDLVDAAQGVYSSGRDWARSKSSNMDANVWWSRGTTAWSHAQTYTGGVRPTGNTAFDDWRRDELAKLEEQRRKLVSAEKDFADHIDGLRRARDREEFDRFMNTRQSANPDAGQGA